MMFVVLGFGEELSPIATPTMKGRVGMPTGGLRRSRGANPTGFPRCAIHIERSSNCWIASAPGTLLMTGCSLRSGVFSLKNGADTGTPARLVSPYTPLSSDGMRASSDRPTESRDPELGLSLRFSKRGAAGAARYATRTSGVYAKKP